MSGPIITVRRLVVDVPKALEPDPVRAGHKARTFAHLHSIATPAIDGPVIDLGDRLQFTVIELGDAAIAASAQRSRT